MPGHVFIVHSDPTQIAGDGLAPFEDVARTAQSAPADPPRRDRSAARARPLIVAAVGAIRDRDGGARFARDLRALIERPDDRGEPDVVVATPDRATFSAALAVRRRCRHPTSLDARSMAIARELATRARGGELVVFVGAGVSASAGVPEWCALMREAARAFGMSPNELQALDELPLLDRAALIERRAAAKSADGRRELRRELARLVRRERASLSHHLLAGLPTRQFVTTNYDDLFERALEAAGRRMSVLPYSRVRDGDGWLLKLHGCVREPDDIVFTREDYLRYEEGRVALAGIMQALLFTQHVLFVGFSLNDDHFHKIADAVRSGEQGRDTRKEPFGTALVLEDEPLRRELWEREVRWVPMRSEPNEQGSTMTALERLECARRLELVLDAVLSEAWPIGPHLLDPRYDSVLDPAERSLASALEALDASVDHGVRSGAEAAWKRVADALAALGQVGSAQQRKPIE